MIPDEDEKECVEPQEHPVDAMPRETEEGPQAAQNGPSPMILDPEALQEKLQALVDGIEPRTLPGMEGPAKIHAVLVLVDGAGFQLAASAQVSKQGAFELLGFGIAELEIALHQDRIAELQAGRR